MGAEWFEHSVPKTDTVDTPEKAFRAAVDEALWDHGHSGYTGTMAEKHDWKWIMVPDGKDWKEHAEDVYQYDELSDKWGPAGCIEMQEPDGTVTGWLFLGWASS